LSHTRFKKRREKTASQLGRTFFETEKSASQITMKYITIVINENSWSRAYSPSYSTNEEQLMGRAVLSTIYTDTHDQPTSGRTLVELQYMEARARVSLHQTLEASTPRLCARYFCDFSIFLFGTRIGMQFFGKWRP